MEQKNQQKKRLVLIDGHSILFRAFHAYPELRTKSGELVNAVYGFCNILLGVIKKLEPSHLAVSFDREEPTFRHREYEGYKAHRPETPEELISQQDRVEEVVKVLNVPIFAKEGYEADDVIGTLAKQASKLDSQGSRLEIVIVTGDQDIFQLVNESSEDFGKSGRIRVFTPARGKKKEKLWDPESLEDKYGLKTQQLVDLKALSGDASDAIPGVKGIGPKTATKLLKKYGDLENLYRNLDKVKAEFGKSVYEKLEQGKESAQLSKRLATIDTDVPLKLVLEDCRVHDFDKARVIEKFKELEFTSLVDKLPDDSFEQMVREEMFG